MKVVFVDIILNIHQIGVADELYKLTNGKFHFIETQLRSERDLKGGESDYSLRPYWLNYELSGDKQSIEQLVRDADVMIYGSGSFRLLKERMMTGRLTFHYSERWLKRGILNLLSPRLIRWVVFYHRYCHNKPFYALCSGAYVSQDFSFLGAFKNKCYKWGYFTNVSDFDINDSWRKKNNQETIKILWVGRFIGWKHPEKMLFLAKYLNVRGYNFRIDMIGGNSEIKRKLQKRVAEECLSDKINMLDPLPNDRLKILMRDYHIFCFTSDKREGWGAVLNESMGAGCCPVASVECGSTPYLIDDGINGVLFNPKRENEMNEKVEYLINHRLDLMNVGYNAYTTIRENWNPINASINLYELMSSILHGLYTPALYGPCEKED